MSPLEILDQAKVTLPENPTVFNITLQVMLVGVENTAGQVSFTFAVGDAGGVEYITLDPASIQAVTP